MLDRAFLRSFFDQIESFSDDEIQAKIAQVEKLKQTFAKSSEALADARFVLRHLRRELLQRQLTGAKK